jgi:hypothetical protein
LLKREHSHTQNEVIEIKPTMIQKTETVARRLSEVKKVVEESGFSYCTIGDEEIYPTQKALGEEFVHAIECYKSGC